MTVYKKLAFSALALCAAVSMTACSIGGTAQFADTAAVTDSKSITEYFTDRDQTTSYNASESVYITLKDNGSACSSSYVQINGDTVTVRNAGTYVFSGALTNGAIVVEANAIDKVQLIFDGVTVTNASHAALYVKNADKVFVTLSDNTENSLVCSGAFVQTDTNTVDGAVFSKDDLTVNGNGKLTVSAISGHGIVSKDDLTVCGGNYTINTANQGISGKDCIKISDGTFNITSGKDGIHSENTEDTTLGYIVIGGGNFTINSGSDGISASLSTRIDGGIFNLTCGGKGVKGASHVIINGGDINVNSSDDSVHSNGKIAFYNGKLTLSTNDDGIHADSNLTVGGGIILINKSYEGLEAQTVVISGGDITLTSSDDGINAAGGADSSGTIGGAPQGGAPQGGDSFTNSASGSIEISGGIVRVNASGDGVDSNGNITISGGETYVSGPTNNGNAALDYDGTATISGGLFIATGSTGMAQNFSSGSTQGSILVNSVGSANATVTLKNASGDVLVSFTPSKSFGCVVVSASGLTVGNTYTLTVGSTSTSINLTSLIYGSQGGAAPGGGRR